MAESRVVPQKEVPPQTRSESTRSGVMFTPLVDIFETDQELTVYADVPGVRGADVDLRYEGGELLLQGRVRPRHPEPGFLLNEYDEGDFYRAFTIHESIDSNRISAECKNGVLTVHLPKAEAARPKQIKIRSE